jgi:hypothetical protein
MTPEMSKDGLALGVHDSCKKAGATRHTHSRLSNEWSIRERVVLINTDGDAERRRVVWRGSRALSSSPPCPWAAAPG